MSTETTASPTPAEHQRTHEAPGPGVWERDIDHETRPRTLLFTSLMRVAFTDGFDSFFSRYGLPLARAEFRSVDGWSYMRMIAVGETDKNAGSPPPPPLVMKVLSRVHPVLRRRAKAATAAMVDRLWLQDVEAWDLERDQWRRRIIGAQQVSFDDASDADVASCVRAHYEQAIAMATRHFELLGPGLGIGIFLSACEDWGVDLDVAVAALGGGSESTSSTRRALRVIADAAGPALMEVDSLQALQSVADDVAPLIEDYLDEFGWRSLNDDFDQPMLAERPAVLLRSVRAAAQGADIDRTMSHTVPNGVPTEATARFQELLDDARRCLDCLDDNSGFTAWATGATRRTLLEAGRRLVARDLLSSADHVFELQLDEIEALLVGRHGPAASEAALRSVDRRSSAEHPPPLRLGGEAVAPPPHDVFPRAMGQLVRAMGVYLGQRFEGAARLADGSAQTGGEVRAEDVLVASGIGIDLGTCSGRACVVDTPGEALERLEPGDVLVCSTTSPAYNAVFPIAAGVVTGFGGPLGHAAVTARELGIPAVVGVGNHRIVDGQRIEVVS